MIAHRSLAAALTAIIRCQRQLSRLLKLWVVEAGLDPSSCPV
jgi:hypothetical protein